MNIVPLLLFCSLVLVAGSVVLFVVSARRGDCDEADRLCLLPLEDDAAPAAPRGDTAPPVEPLAAPAPPPSPPMPSNPLPAIARNLP